jgi:hypothetical protein
VLAFTLYAEERWLLHSKRFMTGLALTLFGTIGLAMLRGDLDNMDANLGVGLALFALLIAVLARHLLSLENPTGKRTGARTAQGPMALLHAVGRPLAMEIVPLHRPGKPAALAQVVGQPEDVKPPHRRCHQSGQHEAPELALADDPAQRRAEGRPLRGPRAGLGGYDCLATALAIPSCSLAMVR